MLHNPSRPASLKPALISRPANIQDPTTPPSSSFTIAITDLAPTQDKFAPSRVKSSQVPSPWCMSVSRHPDPRHSPRHSYSRGPLSPTSILGEKLAQVSVITQIQPASVLIFMCLTFNLLRSRSDVPAG
ncbi:hypothetical protein K438DRAFT_2024861 [Mycena galopus ATCC 62051]|nr:hypothetical protein K438DRAFT_2024861 [Mycena galopus ATCC 62051]